MAAGRSARATRDQMPPKARALARGASRCSWPGMSSHAHRAATERRPPRQGRGGQLRLAMPACRRREGCHPSPSPRPNPPMRSMSWEAVATRTTAAASLRPARTPLLGVAAPRPQELRGELQDSGRSTKRPMPHLCGPRRPHHKGGRNNAGAAQHPLRWEPGERRRPRPRPDGARTAPGSPGPWSKTVPCRGAWMGSTRVHCSCAVSYMYGARRGHGRALATSVRPPLPCPRLAPLSRQAPALPRGPMPAQVLVNLAVHRATGSRLSG
mmetsp:Transcript_60814/g.133626  ORF Transcript_60814/g.133626 Transcript_60814/m.133626 type:complete len:268 (-) Transcript_60814:503-1306(-)